MGLQITTLVEYLVTFKTGIWLLSCLNPFMLFQITICKWLVAFGTEKWLLSCVDPFILLQITLLCKWLVTFGTGKWLLSYYLFMGLQITTQAECLVAFGTSKLLLSCVGHVIYLHTYVGESPLTFVTKLLLGETTNRDKWYTVGFVFACSSCTWGAFSQIFIHLEIKPRHRLGDTLVLYISESRQL